MEHRQRMQQAVASREPPGRGEGLGVDTEIEVGEADALRFAGGAGGIQQRGERLPVDLDDVLRIGARAARLPQAAVTVRVQRVQDARTRRIGEPEQFHAARGVGDYGRRLRVAQEIIEFRRRIRRVQRVEDQARAQARKVEQQRLRAFLHLHADPIAGHETRRRQEIREARALALDLAVAQRRARVGLEQQRRRVREMRAEARIEIRDDIHGRDLTGCAQSVLS